MRPVRQITDPVYLQIIFILLMSLMAPGVFGQSSQFLPVNIFGDGNPENGVEDSRDQVFGGPHGTAGPDVRYLNAGTVRCDGKVRGTAMVIDTSDYAHDLEGVVIATAAHVIYDLDRKRRFRRCNFHFLALHELASYGARIDLQTARMGGFDPRRETDSVDFGEGDWVFLHIPKRWKSFNPESAVSLREFSYMQMESFQQNGGELRLIAFDSTAGVISISKNCTVVESTVDDLGGGTWKGQLLDDCDSAGGASGGGIVAILGEALYLVGIRSGSHWSEQVFPGGEYPTGPPDGSIWNRHTNTNFGRAVDTHLMRELAEFVQILESGRSRF